MNSWGFQKRTSESPTTDLHLVNPGLALSILFCARDLSLSLLVDGFVNFPIKTNGSWFVDFWQIQNWGSMTCQSESCLNFLWGVPFKGIFLLSYTSSPVILGDLIGSRVSESWKWLASDVFHSRTRNLWSGCLIPHDFLVIHDHWCQKKQEPIVTANSVQSIIESSWFLKKVNNRIMSVYLLLCTVVLRLLHAKVDRHNWGSTTSYYLWSPRLPGYSLLHFNYDHQSWLRPPTSWS